MNTASTETSSGSPPLSGRVAVVVGGSSGLGEAIAESFAAAGATVVIASRKLDQCQAVADRILNKTNQTATAYAFHIGHWDECDALIEFVYAEYGRLDVLVNSAGLSPAFDSLLDVTEDYWDAVFSVNAKGPFRLCVAAAERMKRAGSGSIINISSTASLRPRPEVLPYAAAKAALNAMSKGLVHAFAPEVRINTLHPGPFHSRMTSGWPPEVVEERGSERALKRMGTPEDIVGAALFLASSEASGYITGVEISVDGGAPI